MKRILSVFSFLMCALALQAQPAGGFGGWQMAQIDVHCSEKFADLDYVGDDQVYHKLDIYLPKVEKESYPVAIHIYGSAWFSNNSKGMADLGTIVNALLDAGYAVVTPNHRSSMDAKFPAQIHDIKAVVRYVRGNADKYKFDTDYIVTSGFSSGAHLASLAATSNGVAELEGSLGVYTNYSSLVDAACCWSGPTDLNYMSCGREVDDWNHGPEEAVMGFSFKGNEEAFKALNATTYIDPSDPPVVVFHGTADNVVPVCQGEHFHELLNKAGVTTELHLVDGGGHGMGMYAPENLEMEGKRILVNYPYYAYIRIADGCDNITVGVSDLLRGVDTDGGKYDFCVANIVSDIIIRMLPDVRNYIKSGAPLILSGIIGERADEVREAVLSHGFTVEKEIRENDWVGMLVTVRY